jgi:hypothetical protein
MSVTAKYKARVDVTEILPDAGLGDATVLHNNYSTERTISASTTPPATMVASFVEALIGGAGGIDMTALVGTNGAAVDLTGLKVQMIKINAPAANTGVITIVPGVANGLDLFGASSSIGLLPGQELCFYFNDAAEDISPTVAELDLAGTGTETLEVVVVAG